MCTQITTGEAKKLKQADLSPQRKEMITCLHPKMMENDSGYMLVTFFYLCVKGICTLERFQLKHILTFAVHLVLSSLSSGNFFQICVLLKYSQYKQTSVRLQNFGPPLSHNPPPISFNVPPPISFLHKSRDLQVPPEFTISHYISNL